ncbi:hypothetical protein [Gilvimarinus agarilyticus]|uniref:hypothetical protein n=1 Tax=Gilvimarinus agarilyticus TaxID=679259 RepID=UPI0005A2B8DC|nr:hypothetical protein [Gilvimarinus agarilyticus]
MIDFVAWIYEWMAFILLAIFLPWVICALMTIYSLFRKSPKKVVARYAFSCMGIIIFIGIFSVVLNNIARIAVVREVERISSGNGFQALVKDLVYRSPYDMVASFSEDRLRVKKSGSRPKEKIHISMQSSEGEIKFIFFRDSRDKDVYWVWYTGYKGPHNGNFYLKTDLLNDF